MVWQVIWTETRAILFVMSAKFSQEEREVLVKTMSDLISLTGELKDKELQDKMLEHILGLCDQLKSRLIMDMDR